MRVLLPANLSGKTGTVGDVTVTCLSLCSGREGWRTVYALADLTVCLQWI